MMRVLEANAPPKQTATDTISTLSGRLTSATLLEDRRAAILGLRSFAKEYPASVASGALRGLIASLTKDGEDVDTLKVVLETLLMLFHPDEQSPEASEEIELWLADQFSQRQDNITLLVDLLEKPDFYARLYSLQLIRAISQARPQRTQECVLTAPGGIERLVDTLDDPRDAVRNEALVVLTELSRTSPELQKLFVFEDAFTKVFNMIHADGGLTQGGMVVQDCLNLLAALIRSNVSNQTNIREMGHVARFAALLPGGKKPKKARTAAEQEDDWVSPQSDKNIWGLLAIMRMFLVKGNPGTLQNQNVFQQNGLVRQLLNIAFDPATAMPIKIEALNTCADLIRGNARLQEGFAQEQVRPIVESATNGLVSPNSVASVYVIEALLNLVLSPAPNELFDLRNAGCECIKAYFYNHVQIQEHFLNRAIGGHEGGDETANALTILMGGPQVPPTGDPYRIWFAANLIYHLIFDDYQAKETLMQVKEGDAESGEEVVTCIQTLTANLIASLQLGEDERISIAYLMLLLGWLFEDAAAVDDFLAEASSLQSLVQAVLTPGEDRVLIRGLCAALLGVVYEFSTRDSPVPRRELQPVLTSKLGRDKYLDAITGLRHHPLVRDFEVLPRNSGSGGSLPDVFFDEAFIDFLKDNFSRLSRAIDRNPNIEQHHSHDGVDRDVVDALRGERDEKEQTIQELKAQLMTLEQKIDQEQAEHRKTQQSAEEQRSTLKRINDKLHEDLDKEVAKRDREFRQAMLETENRYNLQIVALNNKVQQASKDANLAVSKVRQEYDEQLHGSNRARDELEKRLAVSDKARQEAVATIRSLEEMLQQTRIEVATITETLSNAQSHVQNSEAQLKQLQEEKESQIQLLREEKEAQLKQSKLEKDNLQSTIDKLKEEVQELKTKAQDQIWKVKDAEEKLRKAEAAAVTKSAKEKAITDLQEKLRKAVESEKEKTTELEDLILVLSDLEEKRSKDKERLKALGEEVSDDEDEDDEDDEDEEEEENDDEEEDDK
ncbi:Intracellular protein transport protein [Pyrenophora tritici-repentis]|uniref:Intracellular protein transport protein n=2 Tax=Pyrenophora tritici-repentis TaxID=45151 RepID=A0A922NDW9_9PLEO|nr:intracellular protein transport protein (UsoA) [Pyrenophora tritici-repentis Pt-1C-BFP]EDU40953.1 intracellular protein transport protein (UsoA) [Pyrenophora tritici-repentis Pt-1C-BFP]KAI1513645.1 Intracellular protein transport protein [Pyrenophora tritici-repentis]KAI1674236.1 Intracellular protein transport protein [Pyrenophora tritici-repentis]KAI1688657.1 Intracellular protein transport protein [Pyrenophora tritici-repentis]